MEEYKTIEVTTYYLRYDKDINENCELQAPYDVKKMDVLKTSEYLEVYKKVGEDWGWTGRLKLSPDELQQVLDDEHNEVYYFYKGNELLGFFELDKRQAGKTEILYLGLLPEKTGQGLGKLLLNTALICANEKGTRQVWLHTCECDHPGALGFYKKCGFVLEKTTQEMETYPEAFIGSQDVT